MIYQKNDSAEPLKVLYRQRKIILIVAACSALIAAIFTGPRFVPPTYKAETLMYPPSSNSARIMLSGISRFGSDKEIDEQIQVLKSNDVRDSVISKYDLLQHYNIDTTDKTWKDKLNKKYNENVVIGRTRYNSVSIVVSDTDPVLAAEMANDIIKYGDELKNTVIKKNMLLAFEALEKEQLAKILDVDSMSYRIYALNNQNLMPFTPYSHLTDAEKFKEQTTIGSLINKARAENNHNMLEFLFGFESKLNQLRDIQENYSRLYFDLSAPVPESFIISRAEASYKKTAPMRSVIVIVVFFSSLLIFWTLLVIFKKIPFVIEQLK